MTDETTSTQPLTIADVEPDVFPPDARVAFIFLKEPEWRKAASAGVKELGFYQSTADSVEKAVIKLQLNDYDVLFMDDHPDNAPIRNEVSRWTGQKRRRLNVVLIGSRGRSFDDQVAFNLGVNFYLSADEVSQAPTLLKKCLDGYRLYYRMLNAALDKVFSS
jgi:hypothetical protein